jgi:hypothetical protein
MNERLTAALKDWIPYRLLEESGEDCCRWLYVGDEHFTAPFFNDTIAHCWQLPNNSRLHRCISSVSILPEWSKQMETLSPTAFIFHISRCGSTLLSQLLSLNPENIVLSEVPFFDELLRYGHKKNKMEVTLPLLKAAIELYGAKRDERNKRLFIKTDSWHIHFYKQLRILYPQTPFIFLYRRPDEVIRSQQKRRGMQAVPGVVEPEIFSFDKQAVMLQDLDEYMAKVIETYLVAFKDILLKDKLCLPVNYNEGALTIVEKIAAFSGIQFNEKEMEAMQQRAGYHGKYPDQVFAEEKIQESPAVDLNKAFALYDEVEKIRIATTIIIKTGYNLTKI